MISQILLIVCFIIFVYNIYVYIFSKPENFPPGPPKVPWFGSYIFMLLLDHKHLHCAINRICKYYKSTIIGFYLGDSPVVVLNDYASSKKLLNNRDFDGRPDILQARMRHPTLGLCGIFGTENEVWQEQRRFLLRYMRDFGFGRRFDSLEKEIQIQIAQYIDIVKNGPKYEHEARFHKDGKILLPFAFASTLGNCFMAVLLNEPIERENMAAITTAVEDAFVFQRGTDSYGKLFSVLPIVAKLFPDWSDYKPVREASIGLYKFVSDLVDEQVRTFDESHERHFIDMYINKMRSAQTDPGNGTHFSYDQLILSVVDFTFPVLSTLPSTITFLMQQICHEPQVQRKIQEEIDHVVGQGRAPILDDRVNMPYTEACIREIMRFETIVPSGVPHKALIDTEFMGYTIPKGTTVMPALGAAMHDPTAWDSPNEFRPERFLDSFGKLFLSKDISLPFGAGKRLCAGETFARNMMFLFMTAFLQIFSVKMPNGVRPYKFNENLTGAIRTTPDHWIEVVAR